MNAKDWEAHAALVHKHGSTLKFMQPTKRMLHESPPIERVPTGHGDIVDLLIVIIAAAVLGGVSVLAVLCR